MSQTVISTTIKLRRDNDFNFNKVKNTFIPSKGEPILVDTSTNGLRVKVGDGTKTYNELEFIDSIFIYGYFNNGNFYKESQHTNLISGNSNRLYINSSDNKVYFYNGTNYVAVDGTPNATSTTAGIMILYDTTGQNTDGTMTQKAITDELNKRFKVDIDSSSETIQFSI